MRPDYTGKMVTRWVKDESSASTTTLPVPQLSGTKKPATMSRPVKLTPKQTTNVVSYGMETKNIDRDVYGHNVRRALSEELESVPFDEHHAERAYGGWYRFAATEADFYAVLSVVRPMDAMNLMHRGIRSADDAYTFLADNGVEHLAGDHSALTEALLRHRVEPQAAAPYLDEMIDTGADPAHAAEWIKLTTSGRNLRNATDEVKDDMLSGEVTFADLKLMGIKNLNARSLPDYARFIRLSKADKNPNFTVDDVAAVAKIYAEHIHTSQTFQRNTKINRLESVLNVARFNGSEAVNEIKDHVDPHYYARTYWKLAESGDEVDEKLLSDMTLYYSRLKKNLVFPQPEHDAAVAELFKSGIHPDRVGDYMGRTRLSAEEAGTRMRALLHGIAAPINDGWL